MFWRPWDDYEQDRSFYGEKKAHFGALMVNCEFLDGLSVYIPLPTELKQIVTITPTIE